MEACMSNEYSNVNKGVAFPNDHKSADKHPTWKGKGNFNGQDFEFGIWERTSPKGQYLSFSFSEPYKKPETDMWPEKEQSGYEKAKAQADSLREEQPISLSDIPF